MRPQSGRIFFCVTGGLRPRFSKKIGFCSFGSDIGLIYRLGQARTGVGHGHSVFQSFVAYLGQRPATAILAGFSGVLARFILWFYALEYPTWSGRVVVVLAGLGFFAAN